MSRDSPLARPGGLTSLNFEDLNLMASQKVSKTVTPANAGVQSRRGGMISLDSRVRGNDKNREILTFYEFVKFESDADMGR